MFHVKNLSNPILVTTFSPLTARMLYGFCTKNDSKMKREIKAGKRGTLKSLHVFLAEKKKSTGIRFNTDLPSTGNDLTARVNLPGKEELTYNLISLPLYLAGRLDKIVT